MSEPVSSRSALHAAQANRAAPPATVADYVASDGHFAARPRLEEPFKDILIDYSRAGQPQPQIPVVRPSPASHYYGGPAFPQYRDYDFARAPPHEATHSAFAASPPSDNFHPDIASNPTYQHLSLHGTMPRSSLAKPFDVGESPLDQPRHNYPDNPGSYPRSAASSAYLVNDVETRVQDEARDQSAVVLPRSKRNRKKQKQEQEESNPAEQEANRKEKHNEAEKRRRNDMNGAIERLRELLPLNNNNNSSKSSSAGEPTDSASDSAAKKLTKVGILAEAADHIIRMQKLCEGLIAENNQLKAELRRRGKGQRKKLANEEAQDVALRAEHSSHFERVSENPREEEEEEEEMEEGTNYEEEIRRLLPQRAQSAPSNDESVASGEKSDGSSSLSWPQSILSRIQQKQKQHQQSRHATTKATTATRKRKAVSSDHNKRQRGRKRGQRDKEYEEEEEEEEEQEGEEEGEEHAYDRDRSRSRQQQQQRARTAYDARPRETPPRAILPAERVHYGSHHDGHHRPHQERHSQHHQHVHHVTQQHQQHPYHHPLQQQQPPRYEAEPDYRHQAPRLSAFPAATSAPVQLPYFVSPHPSYEASAPHARHVAPHPSGAPHHYPPPDAPNATYLTPMMPIPPGIGPRYSHGTMQGVRAVLYTLAFVYAFVYLLPMSGVWQPTGDHADHQSETSTGRTLTAYMEDLLSPIVSPSVFDRALLWLWWAIITGIWFLGLVFALGLGRSYVIKGEQQHTKAEERLHEANKLLMSGRPRDSEALYEECLQLLGHPLPATKGNVPRTASLSVALAWEVARHVGHIAKLALIVDRLVMRLKGNASALELEMKAICGVLRSYEDQLDVRYFYCAILGLNLADVTAQHEANMNSAITFRLKGTTNWIARLLCKYTQYRASKIVHSSTDNKKAAPASFVIYTEGVEHFTQGRINEAKKLIKQSATIAKAQNRAWPVRIAALTLGVMNSYEGNFGSSVRHCTYALEAALVHDDKQTISWSYCCMAKVYLMTKEFEKARTVIQAIANMVYDNKPVFEKLLEDSFVAACMVKEGKNLRKGAEMAMETFEGLRYRKDLKFYMFLAYQVLAETALELWELSMNTNNNSRKQQNGKLQKEKAKEAVEEEEETSATNEREMDLSDMQAALTEFAKASVGRLWEISKDYPINKPAAYRLKGELYRLVAKAKACNAYTAKDDKLRAKRKSEEIDELQHEAGKADNEPRGGDEKKTEEEEAKEMKVKRGDLEKAIECWNAGVEAAKRLGLHFEELQCWNHLRGMEMEEFRDRFAADAV